MTTVVEKKISKSAQDAADFETAVTATEYGKFNLLLLLAAAPTCFSAVFESTTMSYVVTAAHCDLNLSLENKGVLNGVTYFGMITSAVLWGFLFDTLGRKRLLVVGFLLDALFVFISSFSQSYIFLLVSKFIGGVIITGPYAAVTSYLSEIHCSKYRSKVQLILGVLNSVGVITMPLLAWLIFPQNINFTLFNFIDIHSWNVFLFIAGIPSLISGVAFIFLPESPKFLMTIGENKKALEIFQNIYKWNTGKSADSYPVKELVNEVDLCKNENKPAIKITASRSKIQALKKGFSQIAPLFHAPYLSKVILVCCINSLGVMSLNMIRLWLPQMFQAINDYQQKHNGTSSSICNMLDSMEPSNINNEECIVNVSNSTVYINSIIVGVTTMLGNGGASCIITYLGKKKLLILSIFIGAAFCISIYFSKDTLSMVTVSSIFVALASVTTNTLLAVIVAMFPTSYRTLTLTLTMMVARVGSMSGNLIFPILLRLGCEPPFFFVASIFIGSGLLCFLLPNTENQSLK